VYEILSVSDKLQNVGQSEILGLYVTHKFNKDRANKNI
jgi:hypothetical protein